MRIIQIQNPILEQTYKTFLGTDYAVSDATAMTVMSTVSFAANDILVVGNPREEFTEAKKLTSKTGATIFALAAALLFAHQKNTPIFKTLWDTVEIEANYGAGFSVITQSSIQWDNKLGETVYFDTNGTDTTSYRFRLYNSVTLTYSEYSATLTGADPYRDSVVYMVWQVRLIAGDRERQIVTDEEIIRYLNRAQDIIYAKNTKWWFLYIDTYKGSNGIVVAANTDVYSLASYTTLGHLARLRYRYTLGNIDNIYDLKFKSELEFDSMNWNLNRATDDWARFYKVLPADSSSTKGYVQIYPKTKTAGIATIYPYYYERMTDLSVDSDRTQVPIPAILEDYAIAQVFSIRGNEAKSQQYMSQFMGPADRKTQLDQISGIVLLQDMDRNQRGGVGQPKSLMAYKGRLGPNNFMGNYRGYSKDYQRENFF